MRRNRLRSLPHRFMNLVHQNNAENNILSTSSCEDDKAKRWTISSFDRDLDQICWLFDTNSTGVKSYCLYKRQGSLTLSFIYFVLFCVLSYVYMTLFLNDYIMQRQKDKIQAGGDRNFSIIDEFNSKHLLGYICEQKAFCF